MYFPKLWFLICHSDLTSHVPVQLRGPKKGTKWEAKPTASPPGSAHGAKELGTFGAELWQLGVGDTGCSRARYPG
jgi:hypothetical protein